MRVGVHLVNANPFTMKKLLLLCPLLSVAGTFVRAQADWCIPEVDVAGGHEAGIVNVTLNGIPEIDRSSPSTEGYVLAGSATTLMKGGFYSLSINKVSGLECSDSNVRVYIDFNGDHVFNEGTETVALLNYTADGVDEFTFLVPYTAVEGATRMRVCQKVTPDCGAVTINACGTGDTAGYHGEIEDYSIAISGQVGIGGTELAQRIGMQVQDGSLWLDGVLIGPAVASIEVLDAAGRRILAKDLGELGAAPVHMNVGPCTATGPLFARVLVNGAPVVIKFMGRG